MNLDKVVAERILQLRKELNLTQEKLAEYSEIDVSSIAKIERGERSNIKLNTLDRILKGLNISPTDFFNFDNFSTVDFKLDSLGKKLESETPEKRTEYLNLFTQIIDINK